MCRHRSRRYWCRRRPAAPRTLAPKTISPPALSISSAYSARQRCSPRCRWKALAARRFRRSAARLRGTARDPACAGRERHWQCHADAVVPGVELPRELVATTSLPHSSKGNAVLLAEAFHGGRSGNAVARLQRAGLVVEAGMNDSAVVAGLVSGYAVFLVHDDDSSAGKRRVTSRAVASPTIPAPMTSRSDSRSAIFQVQQNPRLYGASGLVAMTRITPKRQFRGSRFEF